MRIYATAIAIACLSIHTSGTQAATHTTTIEQNRPSTGFVFNGGSASAFLTANKGQTRVNPGEMSVMFVCSNASKGQTYQSTASQIAAGTGATTITDGSIVGNTPVVGYWQFYPRTSLVGTYTSRSLGPAVGDIPEESVHYGQLAMTGVSGNNPTCNSKVVALVGWENKPDQVCIESAYCRTTGPLYMVVGEFQNKGIVDKATITYPDSIELKGGERKRVISVEGSGSGAVHLAITATLSGALRSALVLEDQRGNPIGEGQTIRTDSKSGFRMRATAVNNVGGGTIKGEITVTAQAI